MAKKQIKLKDLSEREIITIQGNTNFISLSGVVVSSPTNSLKDVEKTINRLVDKHHNYLLLKRRFQIKTSMGDYIG